MGALASRPGPGWMGWEEWEVIRWEGLIWEETMVAIWEAMGGPGRPVLEIWEEWEILEPAISICGH